MDWESNPENYDKDRAFMKDVYVSNKSISFLCIWFLFCLFGEVLQFFVSAP